jgi:GTP-binding protein
LHFLDEAKIHVAAGVGGNGCIAFRREKFVPRGGPSGGNGGAGGSVWAVGDQRLNTLYHLKFASIYAAERGRHGEGSNRTGRSGGDLVVALPLGSVITDAESGDELGEVLEDGERLLLAHGGRGGKGNAHFATATRQAPRFAQPGEAGEERDLRIELKLLADAGVVGLPNAGKSTLIAAVSAARPKIADYPFTTLVPQLGVVAPPRGEPFVIADLPGLIEGAARGAGLGHRFLRHVERCRVLLHLVDLSYGAQPAAQELRIVEEELRAFDPALLRKPRIVVGSKLDARVAERSTELARAATERGLVYREISAATGAGLPALLVEVAALVAAAGPRNPLRDDEERARSTPAREVGPA